MGAARYIVIETSPKGVSLTWGPFSGPEADDWVRGRKLANPNWIFTTNSLHTPIGGAAWRNQAREASQLAP